MASDGAAELVPDEYALRFERAAQGLLEGLAVKGTIEPGGTASCHWDEASQSWQLTLKMQIVLGEDSA